MSVTTTVTMTTLTPTRVSSDSSATATENATSPTSFVGNTPSTVLFFMALGVGVFIATLFIFFTMRYFIRSKYGLHVHHIAPRNPVNSTHNLVTNVGAMYHTTAELQEQLNYIREHHFVRSDLINRRLHQRARSRRRRRRNRFSKMKKLSEEQVEKLFPKKTYHEWLNGGKEDDINNRDGILREEEMDTVKETQPETQEVEYNHVTSEGIELNDVESSNEKEADLTDINNEDDILHFTSGNCAICLETLENDELVRGLVCGHVFHANCLDPWLTKRRACCPMCKRDYYYKEGDDGASAVVDGNSGETENGLETVNEETNVTETPGTDAINDASNNAGNDANEEVADGNAVISSNQTNGDSSNQTHDESTQQHDANTQAISETQETSGNDNAEDDNESDIDTLDIEAFRTDPTLRAMLHELIPIKERVQMILSDESLVEHNFEGKGNELARQKYKGIFKIFFWKIMGISKQDIFNYGVITAYHEFRVDEERRLHSNQPLPNLDSASVLENQQATNPVEAENANQEHDLGATTDLIERRLSPSQTVHTARSIHSNRESLDNTTIERDIVENRV